MTIDYWLESAVTDAERRGLPELKAILESLARATASLRAADFNDHAKAGQPSASARSSGAASYGGPAEA
jgi:hypothetical protein